MANVTELRGHCVAPFFQESKFPSTGGYVLGRYCAPMPGSTDDLSCCLPCPATDWIYPDNFYSLTRVAAWVNVGALVLSLTILLSFVCLPKAVTKRQYLNVCLIMGIIFMEIGFIVPLGERPEQCYNEITPNGMSSSMTCAWSGALILAGGISITLWILIRTFSMHLQICWDITPGTKFFYAAQILGWSASAGLVASSLIVSGVSFRFGDACHINHTDSLQSLWGPLMGVAGISCLFQLATFAYCLHVYLRNTRHESKPTANGSSAIRSQGALRTRAVYRRVRKVIELQWRGLLICMIMVGDVAFFSVVFVYFDTKTQEALSDFTQLLPWLVCLTEHASSPEGKNQCLDIAKSLVPPESIIIATLILLSIVGIQAWLLVGRWAMVGGWIALLRGKRDERSTGLWLLPKAPNTVDRRPYELLKVDTPATTTTASPVLGSFIKSPDSTYASPLVRTDSGDYFSKEVQVTTEVERTYQSPRMSFSTPRRGRHTDWDPQTSFAKSGLGLQATQEHPAGQMGWL